MLKKAHLLRYPAASPSCRRGKKSLFIRRDATPHLFLSAGSCICLPAEASGAGRGIFEHPEKALCQQTLRDDKRRTWSG